MRIALDATPLSGSPIGGVARYTAELATALACEFPHDEFILVSDQPFASPSTAPNLHCSGAPDNTLERRWWTFGIQRELRRRSAEVFHGLNFAVPFPAVVPAVMTIHDLSPWMKNESWIDQHWRDRSSRVRKRVPWMIRLGAVRHIITPSEAIRREIVRHFALAPQRVTAIALAAASCFRPTVSPQPMPAYFLCAGMLERRKNVDAVVSAWSALRSRYDVDLVIAGPRRREMPVPPPRPGLDIRGEVTDVELAALYSNAIALVYPSLYEGFGLPVLEAMQCGTPVIISCDPALQETAGDAGIVASGETNSIFEAMQSLLDSPQRRAEMRRRSLDRASQFSWRRTARATYDIYRGMLAA